MEKRENIRNFCIIAHIDHGKSTLADRFLELTGTIEKRKMKEQYLDQMDLERERGITIKLQPVTMNYELEGIEYKLNLIDTPGHVDFTYEVSRSLAAVEGAILLVDATKGVQAQTLANLYLAKDQGLKIIPIINKIDLPGARIDKVENEIIGIVENTEEVLKISAKEGKGVESVLKSVIRQIPPPGGDFSKPFKALIFDSNYDSYKGVITYVRVFEGEAKLGDKIFMVGTNQRAEALEVGIFKPNFKSIDILKAGEIGYIATGLKDVSLCRVGDTIINANYKTVAPDFSPLPGYREPKPMVFASFYPSAEADFDRLRDALNKLKLNDAALFFEPESSEALGRGFKCGFLGMLHLEIVSERIKREYNLNLIITTPTVAYQLQRKNVRKEEIIHSAQEMPDPSLIQEIREPWVKLEIITPSQYIGTVIKLLEVSDGIYKNTNYLGIERAIIEYEMPLREIIVDFYDRLKSSTSGFASMSYNLTDWRAGDLVRLDILVAGNKVEAFSRIVPRHKAQNEGRAMVEKLKEIIPPQLFAVVLQAALGGKIIARETIRVLRKDVTGYLYGGDYTRKRKLLEKQKKGKKKMKAMGKIDIPQDVFLKALKK